MRRLALCASLVVGATLASGASASQIISTSAVTGLTLQVNHKGEALVTYTSHGKRVHVLVWGAKNALPPTRGGRQVAFQLDYSGGYGKYFEHDPAAQELAREYSKIRGTQGYLASPIVRKLQRVQQAADNYWQTFHGGCAPYDGPPLAWAVATCKAPDGSYWAVQEWARKLPDYGTTPTKTEAALEVHLSHWTGPLPVLTIHTDWSYHRWQHLYGTFTYRGRPVYGFRSTSHGVPLDKWGRNVFVDTFDSAYGKGWRRENSFLTHKGTGVFCYSINPHGSHPQGKGTLYRATIMGPGVTPDVMWTGVPPGAYNKTADAKYNAAIAALHDPLCRPN
jgi:hypothetical protein